MTTDRLAALLDDALRPYLALLRSPDDQNDKIIRGVAARLAAAGVTLAPPPDPLPRRHRPVCANDDQPWPCDEIVRLVDAGVTFASDWEPTVADVLIAAILPARSRKHPVWTWDDEERSIRTRMCLCCGRPGHYQSVVDAVVRERGMDGMGVLVEDGYVKDGHHRVVAALTAGLSSVPVESVEEAQARWVRDHGYVDWFNRRFGDE